MEDNAMAKIFTVTILHNQTVAVDIEAETEQEVREIVEASLFLDLCRSNPTRLVHTEFGIDEITEN